MVQVQMLTLYGSPRSIENAKALLASKEQVVPTSEESGSKAFKISPFDQTIENDLIVLLAQSGIDGFRLTKQPGQR